MLPYLKLAALCLAVVLGIAACSLSAFRPTARVSLALKESGRPGPSLDSMSCVVFSFEGASVGDQLASGQLGGRTPSCLGLAGVLSQTVSVSQAKSGIELSLPVGTYQIRAMGFESSGGACAGATVPSIVSLPSPKVYLLASESADLVAGNRAVELPVTYEPSTAIERIFDCTSDKWRAVSEINAPSPRYFHSAVWTGNKMIVWGGTTNQTSGLGSGGIYDPFTDSWTAMSTSGAPAPRYLHRAVWTGNSMLVWGGMTGAGAFRNDGYVYDLVTGWSPMSPPVSPSARANFEAVWTGTQMLIWGGIGGSGYDPIGWRYTLAGDAWEAMPLPGALGGAQDFPAVWTGTELIFWGGQGASLMDEGARYPPGGAWQTLPPSGLQPMYRHGGVWTGTQYLVWGGKFECQLRRSGGAIRSHCRCVDAHGALSVWGLHRKFFDVVDGQRGTGVGWAAV